MIKLLQGEAKTLFALREIRGEWIDAKTLSLKLYPDKVSSELFHRTRNRLLALETAGLAQSKRQQGKHAAKLYTVTESGMWDPIDVTVNNYNKSDAARRMRSASMSAYHAAKRALAERRPSEDAIDAWLSQEPTRIVVAAVNAPRVSRAALSGASVFAWAQR